jgi:hypothetical protein
MVVVVPLEDVCTRMDKILYYLEVASMSSQVQGCPLLDSTCYIQVKQIVHMA